MSQPTQQDVPVILIADDDEIMRDIIHGILDAVGYEVVQASNGIDAIALYEQLQPDLLLLDIHLPEKDGITVCHELHDIYGTDCAPIMFISALDKKFNARETLQWCGDDYMTKPFYPKELRQRVDRLLGLRQQ